MTACLIEHFSPLEDPRIDRNKRYELIDIIVLAVSAMASGADGWEAIEDFGKTVSAKESASFPTPPRAPDFSLSST